MIGHARVKFLVGLHCIFAGLCAHAKQDLVVGWHTLSMPVQYHYSIVKVNEANSFAGFPEAPERKELINSFLMQGDIPLLAQMELAMAWGGMHVAQPLQIDPYKQYLVGVREGLESLQKQMMEVGRRDRKSIDESIKRVETNLAGITYALSVDSQQAVQEAKLTPELRVAFEWYGQLGAGYIIAVKEALARPGGTVLPKHVVEYVVKKTDYFPCWALLPIADILDIMARSGKSISAAQVDDRVEVLRITIKLTIAQFQECFTQDDNSARLLIQKLTDLKKIKRGGAVSDQAIPESDVKTEVQNFTGLIRQTLPIGYTTQQVDILEAAVVAWDIDAMVDNLELFRKALAQDMLAQKQWLDLLK